MTLSISEWRRACYAFLIIGVLFACVQKVEYQQVSIPELLPRSEKIQLGKEWEQVQNIYAAQKSKLKTASDHLALLNLGQLFVKEARVTGEHGHYYPAALEMTNAILKDENIGSDIKFRTLLTKAGVLLSQHEFWAALETGSEALLLNRHNAQVYGVLVDAYVELGNYKKAIEMADKMISIKPDIRSYSRISYLREIHGDYKGSIDAMTMAVKSGSPGSEETAWAMQTLGELYLAYGEQDKAQKVFKEILILRDNYPFAIAGLGKIELQKENIAEATVLTQKAMDIIPEVGFYTQMAEIYKIQNRTNEFDEIMLEVMAMLEDDVVHGHNMNLEYADVYLGLFDDKETALSYGLSEYEKRPKNIGVNQFLAKIYIEQGDLDLAKSHLKEAQSTHSQDPELLTLLRQLQSNQDISSI